MDQQLEETNTPMEETPVIKVRSDELQTPTHSDHQLLRDQTTSRLVNPDQRVAAEQVYVKPVLQDDTAGVYIIAVVAGISAAATVGLIAFGIGWYK